MRRRAVLSNLGMGFALFLVWGLFFQFSHDLSLLTASILVPVAVVCLLKAFAIGVFGLEWQTDKSIRNVSVVFGLIIGLIALAVSWRAAELLGGDTPRTWILRIFLPAVLGWMYGRLLASYFSKPNRDKID